jgi:hypothetical protein
MSFLDTRIKRIEDRIGNTATPKTPEEISQAFVRGEYGNTADLFRQILSAPDRDAFFESLRGRLPSVIIDQLRGAESRGKKSGNLSTG